MNRLSIACALIVGAGLFSSPAHSAEAEPTLEFALVDADHLKRIALDIQCREDSYAQLWDKKFAALFADCDLDGNGRLTAVETVRLPSARALREATCSGFAPVIGKSPAIAQLDQDAGGDVSLDELKAYYRAEDVGAPVVGIGGALFTADLNKALLAQLDHNADGHVDLDEWKQAESILDQLDQNDDELIGAGELVAGITYPGASGNLLLEAPRDDRQALPASLAGFPLSRLPKRHDDIVWANRLAGGPEELASLASVTAWRRDSPVERWQLTIAEQDGRERLAVAGVTTDDSTAEIPCLKGERNWLTVRVDQGQTASRIDQLRTHTRKSLQAADKNQDGRLTQEEWSAERGGFGAATVAVWDRDGDGVLTESEVEAWLKLQQEIGAGLVMVTVIDCGDGLLELLDVDRNGALSRRELRQASARLEEAGCIEKGEVDLKRLPRQILVTISQGLPTSPLGAIERRGPDWFLSMDRNADGHVSEVEFVGGLEAFNSLDANGDRLITVDEVDRIGQ